MEDSLLGLNVLLQGFGHKPAIFIPNFLAAVFFLGIAAVRCTQDIVALIPIPDLFIIYRQWLRAGGEYSANMG